jgi:hypothetical protein
MQKYYSILAVILLTMASSASFAATKSFWAVGSDDNAVEAKFLNGKETKSVSIAYALDSNWQDISAKLWLKASDDTFGVRHCQNGECKDGSGWGQDGSEKAIVSIAGQSGSLTSPEIGGYGWYEFDTDIASYLIGKDNFVAEIKVALGEDFYFKNAKLVIEYITPIPAAIWLFGSAFLGSNVSLY